MAIKKKSKRPNLQTIVAVTGVILTAISISIGFYYNSRTQLLKEQELAEKKRLDSITQANEYFKTEKNFKDENEKLIEKGSRSIPLRFRNNSDTGLALCVHYYTLNKTWVTEGYFIMKPGQELNFYERTNYPGLYISVCYNDGTPVNDKYVIANTSNIYAQPYYEKAIREKYPFLLIADYHAPYATSTARFYEVSPDKENLIVLELSNRKIAQDLSAFAGKYHLVSKKSKKDSVLRIAKKLWHNMTH